MKICLGQMRPSVETGYDCPCGWMWLTIMGIELLLDALVCIEMNVSVIISGEDCGAIFKRYPVLECRWCKKFRIVGSNLASKMKTPSTIPNACGVITMGAVGHKCSKGFDPLTP